MPTPTEVRVVAEVLANPANASATAEEVSARVWEAVESCRRRNYKFVVIGQSRRKALEAGRAFHPTWVLGPFHTAAEAASAARQERIRLKASGLVPHNQTGDASVMAAQVFESGDDVDPDTLQEVIL